MAGSRKPPSVSERLGIGSLLAPLRGKRVAVGLSGGLDSVVLLHVMHGLAPKLGYKLSAIHVNHGLSPNAGDWQKFCSVFCLERGVPFKAIKVDVKKKGRGLGGGGARSAPRSLQQGSRRRHRARAPPRRPGRNGPVQPAARDGPCRRERHARARQARGQDSAAPAARHSARRDPRLRRRAAPGLDRGRIECRRVADAQLHPPARRAAAGGRGSRAGARTSRARRATSPARNSTRRRCCVPT